MAEKKEATNEEYADLITHHNVGKTKKPEPSKNADGWKDWIAEITKDAPEPEPEPKDEEGMIPHN